MAYECPHAVPTVVEDSQLSEIHQLNWVFCSCKAKHEELPQDRWRAESPWTARAQERYARELRMTVRVMKPKDTAMGRGRHQTGLTVRTLKI